MTRVVNKRRGAFGLRVAYCVLTAGHAPRNTQYVLPIPCMHEDPQKDYK